MPHSVGGNESSGKDESTRNFELEYRPRTAPRRDAVRRGRRDELDRIGINRRRPPFTSPGSNSKFKSQRRDERGEVTRHTLTMLPGVGSMEAAVSFPYSDVSRPSPSRSRLASFVAHA